MPKPLDNYLRTHRRRVRLTQAELGYLIGRAGASVSHIERRDRVPKLENALAFQVIFGTTAHQLFPGVYEETQARVVIRARLLLRALPHDDPVVAEKRFILEQLVSRVHVPAYER